MSFAKAIPSTGSSIVVPSLSCTFILSTTFTESTVAVEPALKVTLNVLEEPAATTVFGSSVAVKFGVEKLTLFTVTAFPPRFVRAITSLEKLLPELTLYADQLVLLRETLLVLRSVISILSSERALAL